MSKISAYGAASPLDGTETFPLNQSGTTKKGLVSAIKTYIQSLFGAPYASGRYYAPEGIHLVSVGSTMVAGTIYLTPGFVRRSVSISALIARITTLGTGNCQLAIYAADPATGDPTGAPLFASSSQSTGAAGIVQVATTQTIGPGLYWFGLQVDNVTVVFQSVNPAGLGLEAISGLAASTNMLAASNPVGFTKTGTFGTWPSLTGNRTTDALAEITQRPPAWGFKVT